MMLQFDTTTAVRHRQLHQAADGVPAALELALQHPHPLRTAADADQQPGAGVDRGGGAPGAHALPVLLRQAVLATRPCSPPATRSSSTCWPSTGVRTAANERTATAPARRPGLAGGPQPLAGHPERGARRRRAARLALSAAARPARAVRRDGAGAARRRIRAAPTSTIPHKQAALALAGEATAARPGDRRRQHAHLRRPTATIAADNTDAPALIAALPFADLRAHRAGARRRGQRPGRGVGAAGRRRGRGAGVEPHGRSARRELVRRARRHARSQRPRAADLLVNCTAVGLDGSDPLWPAAARRPATWRATAASSTSSTPSPARRWSTGRREQGVAAVDGLELLIGQGALSFRDLHRGPGVAGGHAGGRDPSRPRRHSSS